MQPIEREIEFENVDPRLADQPEETSPHVRLEQSLDRCECEVPRASHASGLILRCRRTDVRIQTARRCRHEIDRNRLPVVRIGVMQRFGVRLDRIEQCRVQRPQVRGR